MKLFSPFGLIRTPNPLSSRSHINRSTTVGPPPSGLRLSTTRLVSFSNVSNHLRLAASECRPYPIRKQIGSVWAKAKEIPWRAIGGSRHPKSLSSMPLWRAIACLRLLWLRLAKNLAKVGVEGSNPFARSSVFKLAGYARSGLLREARGGAPFRADRATVHSRRVPVARAGFHRSACVTSDVPHAARTMLHLLAQLEPSTSSRGQSRRPSLRLFSRPEVSLSVFGPPANPRSRTFDRLFGRGALERFARGGVGGAGELEPAIEESGQQPRHGREDESERQPR